MAGTKLHFFSFCSGFGLKLSVLETRNSVIGILVNEGELYTWDVSCT